MVTPTTTMITMDPRTYIIFTAMPATPCPRTIIPSMVDMEVMADMAREDMVGMEDMVDMVDMADTEDMERVDMEDMADMAVTITPPRATRAVMATDWEPRPTVPITGTGQVTPSTTSSRRS